MVKWILWLIWLWYFYPYYVGYMYVLWQKICMVLNMFLIVNEWIMYLWSNRWLWNKWHEGTMVHNDPQKSMRSLHLIMLFTLVDYMLATCVTKCLLWLIRVLLSYCLKLLHHCFHVLLLLLSYHSILGSDLGSGPKKWLKSRGHCITLENWVFGHWQKACESDFGFLDTIMPITWEWLRLKISRTSVGPRDRLSEWTTCLLRILKLMLDYCMWCFRWFHFLEVT